MHPGRQMPQRPGRMIQKIKISPVFPEGERVPGSFMTISQDVVEPFAFHLAVIGIAVLIGRAIVWGFGQAFGYKGLPLFPFAMIGGMLINQIVQRTSLADMFDRKIFLRKRNDLLRKTTVVNAGGEADPVISG